MDKQSVRLEDLEKSMQDLDLPPGLDTASSNTIHPSTTPLHPQSFTFPTPPTPHDDFMTDKEKDIIAKLHLNQLHSHNLPTSIADYYYQNMAKRKRAGAEDGPLYFPAGLASIGKTGGKRAVKATEFRVEGSLGSISKTSHHRPRTQFQPPTVSTVVPSTTTTTGSGNETAERLFDLCLVIEEAQLRLAEDVEATPAAQQHCHDMVEGARSKCEHLIATSSLSPLLDNNKGRAAMGRLLSVLSLQQALMVCARVIESLEGAQSLHTASTSSTTPDPLSQDLVPQMVQCISKADWKDTLYLFQLLIKKPSLPWLLQRRTGLVLVCVVLSRLEVIKQQEEGSEHEQELEQYCQQLYSSHLVDHLVDIFFPSSSSAPNSSNQQYTWQCLALIAANVDGDCKREMVLELRETVMAVIETRNARSVKMMNVFLNALGLDASQLQ